MYSTTQVMSALSISNFYFGALKTTLSYYYVSIEQMICCTIHMRFHSYRAAVDSRKRQSSGTEHVPPLRHSPRKDLTSLFSGKSGTT